MILTQETGRGEPDRDVVDAYDQLSSAARRLGDVIRNVLKDELVRIGRRDIAPAQAMIICRIGERAMTPSEMMREGLYAGTNITHNVNRLVEAKLLSRSISDEDRRSVVLRLTPEGEALRLVLSRRLTVDCAARAEASGASPGRMRDVAADLGRICAALAGSVRHI